MYFANLKLNIEDKRNSTLDITEDHNDLVAIILTHVSDHTHSVTVTGMLTQVLCYNWILLYSMNLSY